jgi:UDP-N-acetylglucosamine--N-acetylmuramyl-(pentapeptide) pyrophosphoryl-undecaprenol N-acetylglucosamine transferase
VLVVLTGGGSGGHITPILAVAHELKQLRPDVRLVYIGQRGDGLSDIVQGSPDIDEAHTISAGKLRRYHGEGLRQFIDVKTAGLNLRDLFRTVQGTAGSYRLLKKLKPDVVFIKGGFVGVPVGLAAARLGIPYITHDSDAIPGLANRLIARWASRHAVALPAEVYRYPKSKTVTVGVPVHADFKPVDASAKQAFRHDLGLAAKDKIVLVTGGGLGAQRLNQAVLTALPDLLEEFADLTVVLSVGRNHESSVNAELAAKLSQSQLTRVQIKGYMTDMYRYSGAADVIVTRAGATALAEFAVQHKACVIVPNPYLTAGHQLKNAEYLAEQKAVVTLHETELSKLRHVLSQLLNDEARQQKLGESLAKFAHPDAAKQLAMLLLDQAANTKKSA